jgi:hypothetical protein
LFDADRDLELVARAAQGRAAAARLSGEMAAARAHLERAAGYHRQRGEDALIDSLAVQLDIATLDNWAGQYAAAQQRLFDTHTALLSRLGPNHPLTLNAVNELALAAQRQGQFDEMHRRTAQLRGGTGPTDAWRDDQADTFEAVARVYAGDSQGALPELRRLLRAMERDEGGISPATEPLRRLLGEALARTGQLQEAEAVLREAERNWMRLAGEGNFRLAATRVPLACVLARRGKLGAARTLWNDAATILARELGPQHPYSLAAQSYVALAGPFAAREAPSRAALADRVQRELAWQDGASTLARWLRGAEAPRTWRELPLVF